MNKMQKILLKKYLPAVGLTALTILLMIFFKMNSNKGAKIFEEGKVLLADFYIQNLKPLFYDSPISREDVFEFAVNSQIPIDKNDNKSLQIGTDNTGEEFFQIINTPANKSVNNYSFFKTILKLNKNEEASLDSILDSYIEDLYTAVLVNDDNTYAVNSDLNLLKKAIEYDLYGFTSKVNNDVSSNAKLKQDQRRLDRFVYNFRNNDRSNFIVFAQDTILETSLVFDKLKLEKDFKSLHLNNQELKKELAKNKFEISVAKEANKKEKETLAKNNIVVRTDKNKSKAIVVNNGDINIEIPSIDLSSLNNIANNLNALKSLKIRLQVDSINNKVGILLDNKSKERDNFSFAIGLDEKQLETVIENSVNSVNWENINDWEQFGLKIDSLANSFEINIADSSFHIKVNSPSKKQKIK